MSDHKSKQQGSLPADILKFFRRKGYDFGWNWADVYGEEHKKAFTVAKVMRSDVLTVIRESLDRAIGDGVPFEQWRKDLKPHLQALGWWNDQLSTPDPLTGVQVTIRPPQRLHTIYFTNVRQARAAAQYDRITRNKKTRPLILYVHGASAKPRPEHLAWHGLLLPVDHEFWETHTPSNGWLCSCSVRSVSNREADTLEREGVLSATAEPIMDGDEMTGHVRNQRVAIRRTAPEIKLVPWENKRSGNIKMIPEGIDPGFEYPPGEARDKAIKDALRDDD